MSIRFLYTFVVLLTLVLVACHPAPRPGLEKPDLRLVPVTPAVIPLTGEWLFKTDPSQAGEKRDWHQPDFRDGDWQEIEVPHTWNVMPEHSDYEGLAWYRHRFSLQREVGEAHIRLHFEAVFYLARLWLNGVYLGEHEGGYTSFEFDVSQIARTGEMNLLAVEVDNRRLVNRLPASFGETWSYDWWNYGGIVREASLIVTSRAYIAGQRITAIPQLSSFDLADRAAITATIDLRNVSAGPLQAILTADLREAASGRDVLKLRPEAPVSLQPGSKATVTLKAEVPNPQLWHFDHPNLYHWKVVLHRQDGQLLDTAETTIGIRLVELKDARFYLNGEPVRLVGLTRHADSPQFGLAENTIIMAADYNDLKTMNEVLTRPVHYPQSEYILDYADQYGILFIPEVPAWGLWPRHLTDPHLREIEKQQLFEMVAAGFNHPSVWAWSIANEIRSDTPEGWDFVKEMLSYVKSLDPTRPVGFASNRLGGHPNTDATALSDFVMMNQYFGTWLGPKSNLDPILDAIHQDWPDKTVIISEFGFEPRWNAFGSPPEPLDPAEYYFIPTDTSSDSDQADAQRRQLITEQMEIFRAKPFVAGAIFWTYQDYRTPTGFKMGVVDMNRNRRGSWAVLREEFAPALFDSVTFSSESTGLQSALVALHTRGPIESDLPAYTLRGYRLSWAVTASQGEQTFSRGEVELPTLAPGSQWQGEISWQTPMEPYILRISLLRPTGFVALEGSWKPPP